MTQDSLPSPSIEDDAICERTNGHLSRIVDEGNALRLLPHTVSVGKLLESVHSYPLGPSPVPLCAYKLSLTATNMKAFLWQALEVAGQVAGSTAMATPLSYSAMANQCEALGVGTRKRLSTWLGTDIMVDNQLPRLPCDSQATLPKVIQFDLRRKISSIYIYNFSFRVCFLIKYPAPG